MEHADVAVVGAGRAGTGVGLALAEAGMDVRFITRRPVPMVGTVRAIRIGAREGPRGRAVFVLAVPDQRIPEVLAELVTAGHVNEESVVGHLSGAVPAGTLSAATRLAGRFSAHPLYSFPPPSPPRRMPAGTTVMVDGDTAGAACATIAFRRAGALVAPIEPGAKPLYHAAAVVTANLPAVLILAAADLFKECGVPDPLASAARLLGSVATNLANAPGASTVTGPFVRGDVETIARNISALDARDPDTATLYRLLGARLVDRLRVNRVVSEAAWKAIRETVK
ncbi:MAG: DUF2520 domain-containing protein [Deltaproteobacteria bacterium]|nr:DUF2520 domain-containing protein [Deltaproteobacteria bacterium]